MGTTLGLARFLSLIVIVLATCIGCGGASTSDDGPSVADVASRTIPAGDDGDGALTTDAGGQGVTGRDDGALDAGSGQAPQDAPAASPAQLVEQAVRGNVVLYSISEVDRPLYGWKDIATVAYCADRRFALESRGERLTPQDNFESRSDRGTGTWQAVDQPDGLVAMELAYDDGRRISFPIRVLPTGAFDHGEAINAQLQGPANC